VIDFDRRTLLCAGIAAISTGTLGLSLESRAQGDGDSAESDFWSAIAFEYDLDDRHTILNGGGKSPLPRPVLSALLRYQRHAASQPGPLYVFGNFTGPLDGVYVSPNVFNSTDDIDRFGDAIREIARG